MKEKPKNQNEWANLKLRVDAHGGRVRRWILKTEDLVGQYVYWPIAFGKGQPCQCELELPSLGTVERKSETTHQGRVRATA